MRDDLLLDERGREDIERAIGGAVEGEEDGCCNHLDAELSEDEDDPDWEADELVEWRVLELRKASAFLVALAEGEFQLVHPSEDYSGRICTLDLRSLSSATDPRGRCRSAIRSSQGPSSASFRGPVVRGRAARRPDQEGHDDPYVSNVLAVTALAMETKTDAPAEAIGALLHDVVEDSGRMQRAREIAQRFGFDVLRIVLSNSDTAIDPKPPCRQRKEDYLSAMADKEPDELRVSLADKLHNARAILQDLHAGGDEPWTRLDAGPDEVRSYYRQLADRFLARRESLGPAGAAAAEELDRVVRAIHDLAQPVS